MLYMKQKIVEETDLYLEVNINIGIVEDKMDRKSKILIVDDVAENILMLKNSLESKYNVIGAINGEKAIQLAIKHPKPNLILLDVLMPKMDGFEVCKILKSDNRTKHIPIIF